MDYDVIIIGGGPAGWTAGLYTGRARLKTLLLDSFLTPGQAVITDHIENYPGFPEGINGFELIERFKKQAERFGVECKIGHAKKIEPYKDNEHKGWKIEADNNTYTSLALIIASGASPRKLGISGEEKLKGKGVSYCATCDGALYKEKHVVVIGGGDTAIDEALFLTRFASKVTLIHRRNRLRATKILQERALANEKMVFVWGANAVEILGENKVSGVKARDVQTEEEKDILCDGVFVFVGYTPNTDFLKNVLKLDKNGYIIADSNMGTSEEGIFACGDCTQKLLRQVVTATGDGATAAFNVQRYIEEIKGESYS